MARGIDTKCIHLEEDEGQCSHYGALSYPIYQTATYAHPRNGRHGSPSKEFQSLFFHDDLKHLFCLVPFQLILWEEEYADAVFPFSA